MLSKSHDKLTPNELRFYARHIALPEVNLLGQEKLKNSKVLLIGLGGLGSPLALYLAAAGVGHLGIVEFDTVDFTNLHRQILYTAGQVGDDKLKHGILRLQQLNPHIQITGYPQRLTRDNAREIIRQYDIVADGADNFPTRYLVNDACVLEKKILVSASILGFEGQLSVFGYDDGPCYRCLYPEAPPPGSVPTCAENGVFGVLPGVMGSLQATEVIKLILGIGEPLHRKLLLYDALSSNFTQLNIEKSPHCALCGGHPSIRELVDYEDFCGIKKHSEPGTISAQNLRLKLKNAEPIVLIDVREQFERELEAITPSLHVPLDQLSHHNFELNTDVEIITYCQTGQRSLYAVQLLLERGYSKVKSLAGGIASFYK